MLVALAAGGVASASEPGSLKRDQEPEPIFGCGKAQAMATRFHQDASDPLPTRFAEAMNDTDVLHYELDIEVSDLDPGQNSCFIEGSNRMTIRSLVSPLTEFAFRLREQYTITSALINDTVTVPVNSISTTTRVVDLGSLDPPIGNDDVFTLTIAYNGTSVSAGFGSIEVATQSGGIPVVATLSEAYYAYTWWPAKDGDVFEPGDNSDRATLDFSVTVPDAYSVPANGSLVSEQILFGNRKKFHWHSDYSLPTYLVAFAATEYNRWTAFYDHTDGSMPVEFFIYPSLDSPSSRLAWEQCIPMMHVFKPLFGEYPFLNEKYGIYNFPFGGGMEHQTMTGQGGFGERLTAHELGHQWWGDMVTCKTWSDIWLNEGFATYSECLWEEFRNGDSDPDSYHVCMASEKPWNVDGSCYVPPEDTDNMGRIFSTNFSYRKGAWVLHQFRHLVGDSVFFQVLADYREAFAFSAASTDEFVAVASASAGQDLAWFFDQWVYQIGAPSYRYGWTTTEVNNETLLLINVTQDQQPAYPEVFVMPVDLEITAGGPAQTHTIWNDARNEWFVIPVTDAVTNFAFDPHEWILWTGANPQPYAAGPPKVVAMEPEPGSIKAEGLQVLSIWFQSPVNILPEHVTVTGQNSGTQALTLAGTSNVNPVTVIMDQPLVADSYTISISDAVIATISALELDGEMQDVASSASLPSGDGVPGGSFNASFAVEGSAAIPTTSTWGLGVLTLLLLTGGTIVFRTHTARPHQ
jgi:hypothetical protein